MIIELPFPPSVNHYWGQRVVIKPGRKPFVLMYLTARAKEYRQEVADIVDSTMLQAGIVDAMSGRLAVRLSLHGPTRRMFDIDNFQKSLNDALTHAGLWEDDSQIDDLHIRRGDIVPGGAAVVEVTELKGERR